MADVRMPLALHERRILNLQISDSVNTRHFLYVRLRLSRTTQETRTSFDERIYLCQSTPPRMQTSFMICKISRDTNGSFINMVTHTMVYS